MHRRRFLQLGSVAIASSAIPGLGLTQNAPKLPKYPKFPNNDPRWKKTWETCAASLIGNVRVLGTYSQPVLIEGAQYGGIWMECAPQEGEVFSGLAEYLPATVKGASPLDVARANHTAFFKLQREDGQFPAYIWQKRVGFGQIQMVVPLAATAWELSAKIKEEEFLATAYTACSKWDAWLRKYRNTRGTGLTEGFCTYDTGHDFSPRWKGMPNDCPNKEARNLPALKGLPRLCPDLSATTYGARIALAAMATALSKKNEADRWLEDAEKIRRLILEKLWCEEDGAFYDLDSENKFVRVRGDLMSRVMGEHVLKLSEPRDRHIFQEVWTRQFHNPKAFWTPYPFPSIALDDPTFVRPIPRQ